MRLKRGWLLLLSVLLVAWLFPALGPLLKYGAVPQKSSRALNVLLAGVDVNYDEKAATWPYPAKPEDFSGRTDTIVLAQVFPSGKVNVLSIPRDTWVNTVGWGWGKINGANVHGGTKSLTQTVQKLTGIPIDGYVLLSLSALRDVTTAAGGVTLDVPQRMKYDDYAGKLHVDLQAGRQHLSGQQLEGFLRFRDPYLGDIGRISRQQAFFTAMSNKFKNPLHWWRLPWMVGALNQNIKTDLTRQQIGSLLGASLGGLSVQPHTLPGTVDQRGNWIPNRPAIRTLVQASFTDPNDERNMPILVLNVSAPAGSARRLRDHLAEQGYQNVEVGNGNSAHNETTISGNKARSLQQLLGFGRIVSENPPAGFAPADAVVKLGNDFSREFSELQ